MLTITFNPNKILFSCFWLFTFFYVNGQNTFNILSDKLNEKKIDSILTNSSLSTKKQILKKYTTQLFKQKEYEKLLKYGKLEIELEQVKNTIDKEHMIQLYKIGYALCELDSFPKAIKYFEKIIAHPTIYPKKTGQAYCAIGLIYNELELIKESLSYYEKGFRILEENRKYKMLFKKYINYAITLYNINTKKHISLALKTLIKAEKILHEQNIKNDAVFSLYNQMALTYAHDSIYDFHNAKKYLLKNIKTQDSSYLAITYNNFAYLYLKEKKDSTEYFINKGLKYTSDKISTSNLLDNYASFYLLNNKKHNALKAIHRAIETNIGTNYSIYSSPKESTLSKGADKELLIYCLQQKVDILFKLYTEENKEEYLEQIILNVYAVNDVIKIILDNPNFFETKTKLFWRQQASEAYLKGAYASSLLKKNKLVSYFIEKNKALLLIENILNNTSLSKLPNTVVNRVQKFNNTILSIEDLLNNQQNQAEKKLKDSLFHIKTTFKKLKDSLKTSYPLHFNNYLSFDILPLTSLQKSLGSKDVNISFIWDTFSDKKEALIILFTTKEFSKTVIIDGDNFQNLRNSLNTYKKLIRVPLTTKKQLDSFNKVSNNVYLQLFPTKKLRESLLDKEINIIPDNKLSNIPFESLIIDNTSKTYLIEKSNIHYSYSNSFNTYNNQLERNTNQEFSGFAPINFPSSNKTTLENTKEEINTINRILNGNTFLYEKASKQQFINNSLNSKIIHLATHANGNTSVPHIYFHDKKMSLNEVYTHKNNADLVVLSACETNLGKIQQGEGVFSLARGFFFSGTKSVISSLWNVNDKATTSIMTDFYKNLKDNQSKSEALNNAKRTYLKNHSLAERSPYYWASFVLIGDTSSVFHNNIWLYISIGLVVFLLIFYFFQKKRVTKS
ncbi:CHAT domain-containing protein [Tenacibaculum aiptasiae]|uniref:CHAT domain-containing protein n=1 Tax=Tenacibaculum aiptasiae TaxID=426481 RepID=A0A7J5AAQ5_9FLAO|nr:CHAT domain-containing protein [Tenacibaculum aiptasiae]KAB1154498.1 CHAT domain-containing protein [Tenacibaculum aiptasiae]